MFASEGRWLPARHLFFLARKLMRLFRGESRRLIVSMPPRHGKTAFVWRHFGSWWLGARPRDKVMGVTYQAKQGWRWSKQARGDLAAFGAEVFGVTASTRASQEEWPVLKNGIPTDGLMNALGMEGALTGKGSNCLILDDPVSGVSAVRNPAIRDQMFEWAESDLLSRFEDPNSSAVIVGTRWHEDDIIGRILAAQADGKPPGGYDWEVINLPLLAVEGDPLGRKPGECLWPERWTQEWADNKRATSPDPLAFSALYQGTPLVAEGNLFKREHVRYYEVVGSDFVHEQFRVSSGALVKFLTVDPAFSEKDSADYTAMCAAAVEPSSGRVYVLEMVRKKLAPEKVGPEMRAVMERHGIRRCYVERSGFKSDEMALIRKSFGLPMVEIQPNTNKVERAMPAADYLATGRLLFPARAAWLPGFLHELLAFGPDAGGHDDQVDAVSNAVHVAMKVRVVRRSGHSRSAGEQEDDAWRIGR